MLWLCMIVTILLLLFSAETMLSAQETASTFVHSVMPALFPMMVVGSMISRNSSVFISRTKIFISHIMFGFMAGSPASTRQLAFVAEQQELSSKEYRMLLCMSGVMSPMFFTGVLASRLNSKIAWMMLGCHWSAALLTGGLYAGLAFSMQKFRRTAPKKLPFTAKQTGNPTPPAPVSSIHSPTFADALTGAIREAALAQLSILGAMMVFSILASILREVMLGLFPLWTASHGSVLSIGWSLMEIGGGILALLEEAPATPPWLVCGLCSFGGLSIWLQNLLFLDAKTHPAELLGFRILHGVIAMILCYFVSHWVSAAPTMAQTAAVIPLSGGIASWLPLLLLIALALHRPLA